MPAFACLPPLSSALQPLPSGPLWRRRRGGGGGVAAVSAEATVVTVLQKDSILQTVPNTNLWLINLDRELAVSKVESLVSMQAQAQIFVSKIDDQRCQPRLRSRSLFRNLIPQPDPHRASSYYAPLKVRLDDGRQVIWEGRVEDSTTMSLRYKGYISSKKAARRVLNALRESDVLEIKIPLMESPDLVFRWSLEGAPEAIAQACPGR